MLRILQNTLFLNPGGIIRAVDWEKFEARFLKEERREKDADLRKIEQEVFDDYTATTVWELATKGKLDYLGGVVSTGKEANVFKGTDLEGRTWAYKIYRMETSDFHAMWKYIEGDPRFERVRPQKRSIILAWCQKEFKNLETMRRAGCRSPEAHYRHNNILVMQFLGDDRGAPLIKDVVLDDPDKAYKLIVSDMKKLYKAELVHGDLSEFNIIWWKDKPWLIDVGQAVPSKHPRYEEFLERDCLNIAKYFAKLGVKTTPKELLATVKG
jgi:RIO kinase 1